MICGFIGIINVLEGNAPIAILCLMAAGFCDMFDGAIASTMVRTEQEKHFGIQIDSLSDLICFGVLPAILVYSMTPGKIYTMAISSIYALCALIRLAYFNVDEFERQKKNSGSRELYLGLPVTLAAMFIPLAFGIQYRFAFQSNLLMTITLAIMAACFLLPIPLKKPKKVGKIIFVLAGLAIVIFLYISCKDLIL